MLKMIVEAVAPHAKVLCCNKNGNHVVQLLLDASPKEILAPLYEQLLDCSYDVELSCMAYAQIARNCYGCSVIIKCIIIIMRMSIKNHSIFLSVTIRKIYSIVSAISAAGASCTSAAGVSG